MLFKVLGLLLIPVLLMAPFIPVLMGVVKGKKVKYAFICNIAMFVGILALGVILPLNGFAADTNTAAQAATSTASGFKYIASALAVGLAGIGGGIGVAGSVPAAMGAVSEDPKNFSKGLIFVAMAEGIAIYGLVIALLLVFA
jgi:V/A-type H+/Na+-transporting ATPase subunit K